MPQPPVQITSKEHFDGILKKSKLVVADFFADWCGPCQQIAPVYEALSQSLTRPDLLTFVKVDTEKNQALSEEYQISALPTFLLFQKGKVIQTVQGANPTELRRIIQKLSSELESADEASGSGGGGGSSSSSSNGPWTGAEIPRGYSDISDQVETRNSELLNADDDAGPVKVLFDIAKPAALNNDDNTTKDYVQSGADDQLLLFIPFQGTVKLHTLQITSLPPKGQDDVSRPEVIHLYINRPQNMDFSEADDTEPTQAITLKPEDWNAQGTANISLRFVKFQKTTTLILYVQKGEDDAEAVRIDRIKLIGEAGTKREMGKLQKVGEDE
ncbi:thioredoxin [Pochonia chlamydosporia 170]|uniref:Thioredoxin n=1 Tax=Pochonia chlamydosporia 170 TaxID=1380566 RepID=A0A179G4K1_METCM|nr:thioredoxin [Pochonia chlamydosporia 170]OAQ72737.1 thioredoxin [Pochonia chlamydosporia 170]